jgi:hypothetical protein
MRIELTLEDIFDNENENVKEITREIVEQQRWVTLIRLIFRWIDNKYYETYYYKASTEQQDGSGSEWDEPLGCNEVKLVEKVVKVWEKVD